MSDFSGMEDLLQDFLQEGGELLSDVENKLCDLEKYPDDTNLLNNIFRGFHTIKGGAGFLTAQPLVHLCHEVENLFDQLRHGTETLNPELMDWIMQSSMEIRNMLNVMSSGQMPKDVHFPRPSASSPTSIDQKIDIKPEPFIIKENQNNEQVPEELVHVAMNLGKNDMFAVDIPKVSEVQASVKSTPKQDQPKRLEEKSKDNTIRVDTGRLDQVLNLSGEIGLTKNRLTSLRADILAGKTDQETLHALDQAVSQLDLLVSDLQNSVMKTRMQPIGRLFQKYPRIARDLARQLGKDVDLVLAGEETEIDKTMIEDLSDPLIHLIRNAVDHGIESKEDRMRSGKPEKGTVRLEARQEGDHIVIVVADDGHGMVAEKIKSKAIEKGLITEEEANALDERQSFNLIFLPGFSTKTQISDVSGRGVGMDVVKTNIHKLNGNIEIRSEAGKGSVFVISLPLTLAILPVLVVLLKDQPFALPLSMVREILPIQKENLQEVAGKPTLVVRGEVLPVLNLDSLLGWSSSNDETLGYGVLLQTSEKTFILAVDQFMGRDDAVIKPLDDFRPKGVAGVTTMANGQIVLILDMKELLASC